MKRRKGVRVGGGRGGKLHSLTPLALVGKIITERLLDLASASFNGTATITTIPTHPSPLYDHATLSQLNDSRELSAGR